MSPDAATLLDIVIAARRIRSFIGSMTWDEFRVDLKTQSAVQHQLIVIGEAAKRLSVAFRDAHPSVAWSEIAGQRDVLTHAYHRVSVQRVWDCIAVDIPALLAYVEPLVPREES